MTNTTTLGQVLAEAGKAALIAFIGMALTFLPGLLEAPNLDGLIGLGLSALIACVIAALRALQSFVPQLALGHYFGAFGAIADAFIRTFIAGFIVLVIGVLSAPDYGTWKAMIVAGIAAVLTSALRAAVALLQPGEKPDADGGVRLPTTA